LRKVYDDIKKIPHGQLAVYLSLVMTGESLSPIFSPCNAFLYDSFAVERILIRKKDFVMMIDKEKHWESYYVYLKDFVLKEHYLK
jgi:hypothetical protein